MISVYVNRLSAVEYMRRKDIYHEDFENEDHDNIENNFIDSEWYELALRIHDSETGKDDFIYLDLNNQQAHTFYEFYIRSFSQLLYEKTQSPVGQSEYLNKRLTWGKFY